MHPQCAELTRGGRCEKHKRVMSQAGEEHRATSARRGYGYKWQKASAAFLRAHPLCQCEECKEGMLRVLPASVTDHKIPHRGDMRLFWDPSNWQAMAKECHDKKTALEDGGFGNPLR
jgi:5-methylcytosine-specific restriction protein A